MSMYKPHGEGGRDDPGPNENLSETTDAGRLRWAKVAPIG